MGFQQPPAARHLTLFPYDTQLWEIQSLNPWTQVRNICALGRLSEHWPRHMRAVGALLVLMDTVWTLRKQGCRVGLVLCCGDTRFGLSKWGLGVSTLVLTDGGHEWATGAGRPSLCIAIVFTMGPSGRVAG